MDELWAVYREYFSDNWPLVSCLKNTLITHPIMVKCLDKILVYTP